MSVLCGAWVLISGVVGLDLEEWAWGVAALWLFPEPFAVLCHTRPRTTSREEIAIASIGHIAVGMAAARVYRHGQKTRWTLFASMVTWSFLSMMPDADVLGFAFGIKYADPWGHRGATHALSFSLVSAVVLGLLAPLFGLGAWRTTLVSAVVITSHTVLDTLTDGGLGCALLWPFDNHRYFAPWNPIPVAPIGRRFFSDAGLTVALRELVLFSPLFLYAVWPRKQKP